MFKIKIIVASTRPGRKGPLMADWIHQLLLDKKAFNVELLDLKTIALPFFDEPEHPRLQKYTHEHTKQWSKTIAEADGFIFVTPEYNFGYPATLKNALDFLFVEWNYKPVGFLSYGGLSGGTRAVQQLKQVVTAQKMMPVTEAVNIPFFTKHIDASGKFVGDEHLVKSAEAMIDELGKWMTALSSMSKA